MRTASAILLPSLAVLTGCVARLAVPDTPATREAGAALADASVAAHGGMEAWKAIGGVKFHLRTDGPLSVYPPDTDWIIDPVRNKGVMRWRERGREHEIRFDGEDAIVVEDGRCPESARKRETAASRVRSALFWFGVPWKFRDAGAIVRNAPWVPLSAGAPPSPRYYVTYTVGPTPDDWFLVWLDPTTHRIARVDYVASEFSRAVVIQGRWERYEEVDGLHLVTRRVHRPRSAFLRALARPFVQEVSQITTHVPIDDAMFSVPAACLPLIDPAEVAPPPSPPPAAETQPQAGAEAKATPAPTPAPAPRAPPRRRTPVNVAAETEIAAPRERVFAVATDPAQVPRWQDPDSSVEWKDDPPLAVGARIVFHTELFGRAIAFTVQVTEHVPGTRIVLRSVGMPSLIEVRYEWFDAGVERTRARVAIRGQLAAPRVAAPFIASALRRALRANLDRLRALIER